MRSSIIATAYWSVVILIHIGLALPPAIRDKSWKRFLIALPLSFVAVVLPIYVFSFSAFLVPEWKGGCLYGWLDCFHAGKLALLPLVLWATAALYTVEVLQTPNRTRPWIVGGVVTGAVVSTVCLGIGFIIHGLPWEGMTAWLLVPLYVSIWYLVRSRQLLKAAGTGPAAIAATMLGSVPFWIGAVILSRRTYASLPDTRPTCCIATAAMRGHAGLVGPRVRVTHHGHVQDANRQLLTLWLLEELWTSRAPRSHATFRRIYNVVGPGVASCLTSSFLADLAYLAIKPVEIMARALLRRERRIRTNHGLPSSAAESRR